MSVWIIFCAGCPIIAESKLQSQVALSATGAEYITLPQSLRDLLPILELVAEMKTQDIRGICTEHCVYCKVFEDNAGALELARLPKLCHRTKHINICCHHFCEALGTGIVKTFPCSTKLMTADTVTKCLSHNFTVTILLAF